MSPGDKKRVRLVLGDGPDAIDIGEAEVTEMMDGSFKLNVVVEKEFSGQEGAMGYVGYLPPLPWENI